MAETAGALARARRRDSCLIIMLALVLVYRVCFSMAALDGGRFTVVAGSLFSWKVEK